MFTQHIPRTGKPVGKLFTRAGAVLGVIALGAGLSLVPVSANADEATASYAKGQFLSGTILGTDLANVLSLGSVEARNNGTQDKQTSKDPLDASVIQTVNLENPSGVQLGLGDFLDAGAINQYAEADKGGAALGASGAVGDDGAIGVGNVGSGPAGDLTLDLNKLLGSQFTSVLTDLKLSLEAVAAQAVGTKTSASGDYTLAGATLTLNSPAIADLTTKVNSALDQVNQSLVQLTGNGGALTNAVTGILNPVLGTLGSSANVSVGLTTDLKGAVQSLLDGTYGNGAVSFNLQTGAVSVDLAALLGGDLNNLPANTELLTDAVINQILTGITDTVSALSDQIVSKVEAVLHTAQLNVHADVNLLSSGGTDAQNVCHDEQVPIIGDIVSGVGGLVDGLLGGLTGGATGTVTQGIIGYTTKTVCNVVNTVLPDLKTAVNVDIQGSVDQILAGTAAKSDITATVLGLPVSLSLNQVLNGLTGPLASGLFDGDGAVTTLVNALNTNLVNPAVTGLLGDSSIQTVLTSLLSVKVNVQEITSASPQGSAVASGGRFTETAVRVSVLQGNVSTINLASATVGPNVTTIVDPGCTTNCGPNPPCVTNCGPNPPCLTNCGPTTTTSTGSLAYTGVGIATLIAVILALLAAGAYLAREGYRRNHPQSLSTD